ncbi:MAG: 2-C-methyl-D-erythritol 4-phosphate cytidylyltransferase [Oscillospiraceae bacterium]|nr:2-C-methyl-D-erythritol 4-phosphate cytidylyltransferase [Oscillospiraceae bacterium]
MLGNNFGIIVSAGSGSRMSTPVKKQYLLLDGKPILYYALNRFQMNKNIEEIILVCPKDDIDYCKQEIIELYGLTKVTKVVEGGKTREQSVYCGLKVLEKTSCDIVVIHDGVRPFIRDVHIDEGIKNAWLYGASACGVRLKDTIKIINKNNFVKYTLNRDELISIQTPQCFKYEIIKEAFEKFKTYLDDFTDDTSVVAQYGKKTYIYQGNYENIKITTMDDLQLAKIFLESMEL